MGFHHVPTTKIIKYNNLFISKWPRYQVDKLFGGDYDKAWHTIQTYPDFVQYQKSGYICIVDTTVYVLC